jgi:hypothetical protein
MVFSKPEKAERKNVKKLKIKKEVVVDFEILEKKRYEVI